MEAHERRGHEVLMRVLRTDTLDDPERGLRARALLGVDEARIFGRLRSAPARRDYLGTHLLTRLTLAEFVKGDPKRIQIIPGPVGRPVLERPPGAPPVFLGITRADHIIACAVTAGGPIGIDIEAVRWIGRDPLGVAHTAQRRQMRRRLMLWTLDQAVVRTSGLGMGRWLSRLAADLPGTATRHDPGGGGGRWHFAFLRVENDHVVAVALQCAPDEIPTIRVGPAVLPSLVPRHAPPVPRPRNQGATSP